MPKITLFAPECWTKAGETKLEPPEDGSESAALPEVPDSWARLPEGVYEVDPFPCPNCGGTMVVVGVIEDPVKLKAITKWAAGHQSALTEVLGPPIHQA